MPYNPTGWVAGVTALSAAVGNNFESQYTEATNSIEQDMLQPFVLNGMVATKDGTLAFQLDVTAGVAFIKQTDSTLRRRAQTSTTFSCSGHANQTMFLDLNPDGTYSWNNAHSGVTNHLTICTVVVDGSANILTVTDTRFTSINFFNNTSGTFYEIGGIQVVMYNTSPTLSGLTVTGASTFDAFPTVQVTLGGTNQKVVDMKATDGDEFAFIINSDNSFRLFDFTTSIYLLNISRTGTASFIKLASDAGGFATDGAGNLTISATLTANKLATDGGNFTTDGAGNISKVTGITASGTVTANKISSDTTKVTTDGSGNLAVQGLTVSGASAAPLFQVTLGGAAKKVIEMKATDGHDYNFTINTDSSISLNDVTGAKTLCQWTAGSTSVTNCVESTGTASFGGGSYAFIATSGTGAFFFENGGVKSDGSGGVTATKFTPSAGTSSFNLRGNFSGTGSGTVSHGAGTTPTYADISCSQASSSMTTGVATYTSTQVTVTAGSSFTWKGIAL